MKSYIVSKKIVTEMTSKHPIVAETKEEALMWAREDDLWIQTDHPGLGWEIKETDTLKFSDLENSLIKCRQLLEGERDKYVELDREFYIVEGSADFWKDTAYSLGYEDEEEKRA